jgi:hypothetical protein
MNNPRFGTGFLLSEVRADRQKEQRQGCSRSRQSNTN